MSIIRKDSYWLQNNLSAHGNLRRKWQTHTSRRWRARSDTSRRRKKWRTSRLHDCSEKSMSAWQKSDDDRTSEKLESDNDERSEKNKGKSKSEIMAKV